MAHLLILELPGGNDGDIIEAALARGDSFVFLCSHLAMYQQQAAMARLLEQASQVIEVADFDMHRVLPLVQPAHQAQAFDALLCLIDIRLQEAAELAAHLGLPWLRAAQAGLLRDKFNVRQTLAAAGLPQPECALACSNAELQQAVATLGLPVLIKPADGYGSQNIVVLRHEEDLDPLLSPLDDMLPSRAEYGLGVKANDRLLVERFMQGKVIGCDTLSSQGQHVLLGIHEKTFFAPPSFAIRGGCFLPNQGQFAEIERYVFRVLDAVGFDIGAAHVELMLTETGPQLIEVNPRLVGAKIPRLVSLALHRSLHQDLIAVHCGQTPVITSTPTDVAVSRWVVAEQAGVLREVQLPSWSAQLDGVFEILKQPGQPVRPPYDNADRIGYVMVRAPDRQQAEQLAEQFVSECRVILE